MKLSATAIKRPVLTFVSMILILILGGVSVLNIPLKSLPDINPPIGAVVSSYPGANPKEVLEKVTKPLENQLATLPGLKTMSTTSREGSSLTVLEFNWKTNLDDIESDILSRMNQVQLPDDATDPSFLKFDPSQVPIIQLSFSGGEDPKVFEERMIRLEQHLTQVEGVASIETSGLVTKQMTVELKQDKLEQFRLTQSDIVEMIRANHISLPGETIQSKDKELTTRVVGEINSIEELRDVHVTMNPATGEKVSLADVAEVNITDEDIHSYTRLNQKPAVMMSVLQQSDANTAEVSSAFQKQLAQLLEQPEYNMIESTVTYDQGDYVKMSIHSMSNALILGGAFAMLVLFFFLRNVRSPIIVGISIPFSVIFTFVLMYFANFTLNIMTLGGLALGIGMLVDNSIVVIENINRHLGLGKDRITAAKEGASEVAGAITASTLTTVAVFLPIVFTTGIIGNLFKEFSLTIAFSLFASLIVAITVVPMLASRFLKPVNLEKQTPTSHAKSGLERAIRWSLQHRAIVLLTTFALLAAGLWGLSTVGTQFLPTTDEGFFTIDMELEEGHSLEDTNTAIQKVETYLEDKEAVAHYLAMVGTSQNASFEGGGKNNEAEVLVTMKEERDISTSEFVDDIEQEVRQLLPETNVSFNQQSSTGSTPNTLTFTVRDLEEDRLDSSVAAIQTALEEMDELTTVSNTQTETVEEVQINILPDETFENGLVPAQVAQLVNQVTRGTDATMVTTEEQDIYTVHAAYEDEVVQNTDQLRDLLIKKPDGSFIPLATVAQFERGEGPVSINRINQEGAIEFTLKYGVDENLGDVTAKVQQAIDGLNLPEATEVSFTGDTEMLASSMNDLTLALVLAIVFVYLVMAGQFESFKYPFVIMFSIPLIIIGVSIGLFVTQTPLGVTAIIGLLVLAGVVVNNAIVLVDYILQMKKEGVDTLEAIVETVKIRTRPILMTALTTMLGLVPIALGLGEGTEMQQPMGITVIGGLFSSTFLTLFVIPIIYSFFDKDTRAKKRLKQEERKTEGLRELTKGELLHLIEEIRDDKRYE